MEPIIDVMKNKDKYVISLVIFYESKGIKPKKVYRVLSCVLYSIVDNFVCIENLSCQTKTLSRISSNRIFKTNHF